MPDPVTTVLLGKLKNLAKLAGTNVDLVKMTADKSYAERVLEDIGHSSDDPELVLIVIKLMNRYGMFGVPNDMNKTDKNAGNLR